MGSVAIITARGGSKRIPKKNIKDFCGKPVIAYSIAAALESGLFDRVIVSTDSEEIAEVSMQYGAEIPFMRSEENANDFATTADVLEEVLSRLESLGTVCERFLCLYPTAPFITSGVLREASAIMDEQGDKCDAVVPVVRYSFPVQRAFVERDGLLAYRWPEYRSTRSQDLEPFYHDAGQFYLVKTESFRREHTVVPERTWPLVLSEQKVQDIDTPEDWALAQMKYRTYVLFQS